MFFFTSIQNPRAALLSILYGSTKLQQLVVIRENDTLNNFFFFFFTFALEMHNIPQEKVKIAERKTLPAVIQFTVFKQVCRQPMTKTFLIYKKAPKQSDHWTENSSNEGLRRTQSWELVMLH